MANILRIGFSTSHALTIHEPKRLTNHNNINTKMGIIANIRSALWISPFVIMVHIGNATHKGIRIHHLILRHLVGMIPLKNSLMNKKYIPPTITIIDAKNKPKPTRNGVQNVATSVAFLSWVMHQVAMMTHTQIATKKHLLGIPKGRQSQKSFFSLGVTIVSSLPIHFAIVSSSTCPPFGSSLSIAMLGNSCDLCANVLYFRPPPSMHIG